MTYVVPAKCVNQETESFQVIFLDQEMPARVVEAHDGRISAVVEEDSSDVDMQVLGCLSMIRVQGANS